MFSPIRLRKIAVICGLAGCALSLALPAFAQDDRGARPGNTRTRSSPFDPPVKDVFVVDAGPGLDTGCTFNTDPNHPLLIDVVVNQAVGAVDSNGYLVNPGVLVAEGVVPATVAVVMPAFDVDVNGQPPPESDEVLLNGERLGFLSGDNNIWKLNSFSIPISKIKFPAPSSSGTPTPVANRVQVNVDTLSSGRWCTAIDWVALNIPIKLKAAFTLKPNLGNKIRVRDYASNDTIDTIYKQSFDTSCNLTTDIGPLDEYPFSGPATPGRAQLHAILKRCPVNNQITPEVKVDWKITGTPLKGVAAWSGNEGDVDLTMPGKVGSYEVELTFTVDGKKYPAIKRKLFVTWRAPLTQVDPPRLGWYEKATGWATGQDAEAPILSSLLSGLYSFGGSHWRYGYVFGAVVKCKWQDLVADPITCDYSDCYVFSDVFEKMAATLGLGGLLPVSPDGTHHWGFLTKDRPSLDPNFPGSARPLGSTTYDRYFFTSHSLRLKSSKYYDATFNGIYASPTAFITANMSGLSSVDADGPYSATDEGWNLYERPGHSYDSWGNYAYKAPPPPLAPGPSSIVQGLVSPLKSETKDITFTGNATFELVDEDLDGIAEVSPPTWRSNSTPAANTPSWEPSKRAGN